jgi:hypothetical protein
MFELGFSSEGDEIKIRLKCECNRFYDSSADNQWGGERISICYGRFKNEGTTI